MPPRGTGVDISVAPGARWPCPLPGIRLPALRSRGRGARRRGRFRHDLLACSGHLLTPLAGYLAYLAPARVERR